MFVCWPGLWCSVVPHNDLSCASTLASMASAVVLEAICTSKYETFHLPLTVSLICCLTATADLCAGKDCSGRGTCAEGVCRCTTPGYSGDNCDKEGEPPPITHTQTRINCHPYANMAVLHLTFSVSLGASATASYCS